MTGFFKILGKNDEVTTCECCGKSGLKLTVVLTNGEGEVRYGRDCAARALAAQSFGPRMTATKIERMAEKAELARDKAKANAEYQERLKQRMAETFGN